MEERDVDPAVWRLAFTVIVGAMAVIFDTTIVSVALNDLGHDLHAPLSTIQWVSTGYLLAMFVTIPLAGWAQSVLGGKRLWITGLGVFFLGSTLCAFAWNAESLIAFRVLQGVGGGVMLPLMITLIMQAANGQNVGKVMATVTLPASLGPILGPTLGGIILGAASWRWLFLVNIPFCATGAWLAHRNMPREELSGPRAKLDVTGLLLISPGVALVIFGLSRVETSGGFGSAQVLGPGLAGTALLVAFVLWAKRRQTGALVNVRLFRHRPLASGASLMFLTGAAMFGGLLVLPLYWQQIRGADALGAGLLMIPQGVGTLSSRTFAGRLTDRHGPRWVAFGGFIVMTLATVPFCFVTPGTSKVLLGAALFVRGFGMGTATIPLSGASYIGLDRGEVPDASIITRISQQLGGSLGTAVLAVILEQAAAGAHTLDGAASGFRTAFAWSVAFTAIAVPLSLMLPGRPQRLTPAVALAEDLQLAEGLPA